MIPVDVPDDGTVYALTAETLNSIFASARSQVAGAGVAWDPNGAALATYVQDFNWWPIPFKNNNAAEMPPFAVAEIKSPLAIGDDAGVLVDQVPATGAELRRRYLVNGPSSARPSGTGWGCLLETANYVLYDVADGVPDVNSEWGVAPGTWKIKKDRYGFLPTGSTLTNFGNVMLARQYDLNSVLVRPPSITDTTTNKWAVDTEKDVRVFDKKFTNDLNMAIKTVMNYTKDITDPTTKLALSWFAGGAIVAPLKC